MKYTYSGPDSGITINKGSADKPDWHDVLLRHGAVVDLPDKHEATATLQAQGYLAPLAAPTPAAPVAASGKTPSPKE